MDLLISCLECRKYTHSFIMQDDDFNIFCNRLVSFKYGIHEITKSQPSSELKVITYIRQFFLLILYKELLR